MKKYLKFGILCLLTGLLMMSCKKDPAKFLYGTWKCTIQGFGTSTIEFVQKDNRYIEDGKTTGTWSYDEAGATVSCTPDGKFNDEDPIVLTKTDDGRLQIQIFFGSFYYVKQ